MKWSLNIFTIIFIFMHKWFFVFEKSAYLILYLSQMSCTYFEKLRRSKDGHIIQEKNLAIISLSNHERNRNMWLLFLVSCINHFLVLKNQLTLFCTFLRWLAPILKNFVALKIDTQFKRNSCYFFYVIMMICLNFEKLWCSEDWHIILEKFLFLFI